jgi:hypothetical protein
LLYNKYKADRAIDDNATGSTAADVSTGVPPGFTTIYAVPYNASRSFRLRNNSNEIINYGLSDNDAAFDEPAAKLLPKTQTIKLSSTMATRGDKYIIENTSSNPVSKDLWVME